MLAATIAVEAASVPSLGGVKNPPNTVDSVNVGAYKPGSPKSA